MTKQRETKQAVLQRPVWACDMERFIPDCNKVVDVTRNKHGNWVWTDKYGVFSEDFVFSREGKLLTGIRKSNCKLDGFFEPRLSFDHPLLKQVTPTSALAV